MEAEERTPVAFTLTHALSVVSRDVVSTEHGVLCVDYGTVMEGEIPHVCLLAVTLYGKEDPCWALLDHTRLLAAGLLVELVILPVPHLGDMVFVVAVDPYALLVRSVWSFVELLGGSPLTEEEHGFFVGCVAKHLWSE